MAKLHDMSLPDLYDRKVTSSVEKVILEKENFKVNAPLWCNNVCKLQCKNPPIGEMFKSTPVDVLIIQDFSAFDEVKFRKKGAMIERKHKDIIKAIAHRTLGYMDGQDKRVNYTFEVTDLLKCQVQGTDIKKGKGPTDTILAKCRPYLLEEIRQRKPKIIISLNTAVTKALGIKKTNYRDCGDIVEYEGIPLVLTLHPRILLMLRQNASGQAWGPDFYSIIERDFVKAAWILRGGLKVPNLDAAIEEAKRRIFIARSIEDVEKFCDIIIAAAEIGSVLSFDTETNTLDPFAPDAKIICMQFGFRNVETGKINSYVFPMWHKGNEWYDPKRAWGFIGPILVDERYKKVGHNIKFDMLMVEVILGIRIRGVLFDTMLLLHAINSGLQGMFGLKRAVGNWLPDSELQGYEDKLPRLTRRGNEDGITGNGEEAEEAEVAED
jgi:hypothetical protein